MHLINLTMEKQQIWIAASWSQAGQLQVVVTQHRLQALYGVGNQIQKSNIISVNEAPQIKYNS